jgi:hypothetical protein
MASASRASNAETYAVDNFRQLIFCARGEWRHAPLTLEDPNEGKRGQEDDVQLV